MVVYSNNCPKCLIVQKKLEDKGFEYEKTSDFQELIERGFKTLPMAKVDGELLNFAQIINWINKN